MHFGVRLPHFNLIAADPVAASANIAEAATRAERLGFDSIWVGDHIAPPSAEFHRFGTVWYEAITTLAYVAALTSTVRLGTSVLVAPYRNPLLTAKMLATLDALSGGRLDAGFGTGAMEPEFRALELDTWESRGDTTDSSLRIMKEAWSSDILIDPGAATGRFGFGPRPANPAGVPIWIGGNSRRAARRVAEFGDGWMLVRPTLDDFIEGVDNLRRSCDRAERDMAEVMLGVEHGLLLRDSDSSTRMPFIGRTREVIAQVESYRDAGASHVLFDLHFSAPELNDVTFEQFSDELDELAHDVLPVFRG